MNNTDFHVSSLAAICHNLTDWKLASVILLIQLGHSDLPPTVCLWLDTLFSGVKHDTEPLSLCRRFYLRAGCQKWSDSSSHELLLPPLWVWDGWLAHGDWRSELKIVSRSRGEASRGQLLRIPVSARPYLSSLNKMIIIISEFLPDLWMGRQAPAWLLVASQLWCQGRWWWTEWEKQKRLQLLRQWSLDTIVTLLSPSLLANYYPLLLYSSCRSSYGPAHHLASSPLATLCWAVCYCLL